MKIDSINERADFAEMQTQLDNKDNSKTEMVSAENVENSKISNDAKKTEKNDKSTSDNPDNSDNSKRTVKVLDRLLRFDIEESVSEEGVKSSRVVVSILDEKTGEVIRQIPPEDLKTEVKNLSSFMGIMVDKVA